VHRLSLNFVRDQHGAGFAARSRSRQRDCECFPSVFPRYAGWRSGQNTPHKITQFIQVSFRKADEEVINHIVRTKISQGQLDEAPMTLQQLEQVKQEFVRIITGMYHNRIEYPESSGGITATWQPAAKT